MLLYFIFCDNVYLIFCCYILLCSGGSGEIDSYDDIEKFRQKTGASSVMLARQAEWNCSIFRKEGKLPLDDVIEKYIKYVSYILKK